MACWGVKVPNMLMKSTKMDRQKGRMGKLYPAPARNRGFVGLELNRVTIPQAPKGESDVPSRGRSVVY